MKKFIEHQGIAASLNRLNIDTDQILPKQFMKLISKTGYGRFLFYDWRYDDQGKPKPDFVLNQPVYRQASILVVGDNFGCGSSREHAAWSIDDFGIKVVVSTSFSDIFYNNSIKNSILPIVASAEVLAKLHAEICKHPGVSFKVSLPNQELSTPGGLKLKFDIDPTNKTRLLEGRDEIDQTLKFHPQIDAFEARQKTTRPWLWMRA